MPRAIPAGATTAAASTSTSVENLARDRAKKLFGAEHANVQPHSGSQANMAVYLTAVQPGDTVLGLDLAHGGHLTHGMKLNISGMLYHFVSYGVTRDTHRIDFDQVAALAREHKPKLIVAGASAYPREIPHGKFAEIAREVGAKLFVDMAHYAGLVAAGLHDNPVPRGRFRHHHHAQDAARPAGRAVDVQGGVRQGPGPLGVSRHPGRAADARHRRQGDLLRRGAAARVQALRPADHRQRQGAGRGAAGRRRAAGQRRHRQPPDAASTSRRWASAASRPKRCLGSCGITVNKNMIPFDERKPMDPSGIRIGTPALTTRGMGAGGDASGSPRGCSRRLKLARRRRGCTRAFAARCSICASSFPCRPPGWRKSKARKVESRSVSVAHRATG